MDPISYVVPKNWSTTATAECPAECLTCCKDSYSQLAWVLGAMSESECKFCQSLRYLLGRYDPDDPPKGETATCDKCLMKDFRKVAKHYTCTSDYGKCAKCCMDLTLVYMARYVAGCPVEVWRQVQHMEYEDVGFKYDGSSSCKRPPFSPNPYAPDPDGPNTEDWGRVRFGKENPQGDHDNDYSLTLDLVGDQLG